MKDRIVFSALTICVALATAGSALPVSAASRYTIRDLGALPGGSGTYAYDVNNAGTVVGYAFDGSENRPFVWTNGVMQDLGEFPGASPGEARAINGAGVVIGTSGRRSFVWSDGGLVPLTGLADSDYEYAHSINSQGRIVGISGRYGGIATAIVWTGTTPTALPSLFTGGSGSATDINDNDMIVGISVPENGFRMVATVWQNGQVAALEMPDGHTDSAAWSINAAGVVVGFSGGLGNSSQAARWNDGRITLLTLPAGTWTSEAVDINAAGQIVGTTVQDGGSQATLWELDTPYDLQALLVDPGNWTLFHVSAINDGGQIVAWGSNGGGISSLLLTPVPEPESIALLLGGGAIVALRLAVRRRGA
jgi:probable HAF family extracellular repeat protein